MWKVVIEDDEGKRTVVPLTRDQYTIRTQGRERDPPDGAQHLTRTRSALQEERGATEISTFILEDLTSYNGVFVNGLRITHAQDLAHGDLVQIGDYRIVLQDEVVADAPDPTRSRRCRARRRAAPRSSSTARIDS